MTCRRRRRPGPLVLLVLSPFLAAVWLVRMPMAIIAFLLRPIRRRRVVIVLR